MSAAVTINAVTDAQRREIAERISARMEERGLTNEKLAHEAGVSVKTISRVLNGRNFPRYETMTKIAGALGYSEAELRGTPPPPLGLGADPTQLDEIQRRLEEMAARMEAIEQHMSSSGASRDVDKRVIELLDEWVRTLGRDIGRGKPRSRGASDPLPRSTERAARDMRPGGARRRAQALPPSSE